MTYGEPLAFDFVPPAKIVFGWGRRREVGPLARSLGRRAWIVSGSATFTSSGLLEELCQACSAAGVEAQVLATIETEPTVADVDHAADTLRCESVGAGDLLLALGGGAAIDLAKAAAAMAVQTESPTVRDYLENVGRDLKLAGEPLPVLAMPTTAGTGAEATRNAVISHYDPPFKRSLRSEKILPRIAMVDPELTVSVPPAVTAATGMDAITQLIESAISKKAQPIPTALATDALARAMHAIVEAVEDGQSRRARECMSYAAMLSGMCLANSGLGMAHGVAAALGVHCRVPHGVACALLLPAALRVNRRVRQAELARLAHTLSARTAAMSPEDAVEALSQQIESIAQRIGIPRRLEQVGVRREQLPDLVRDSRGSSMSGNPRELSDEELMEILEDLL